MLIPLSATISVGMPVFLTASFNCSYTTSPLDFVTGINSIGSTASRSQKDLPIGKSDERMPSMTYRHFSAPICNLTASIIHIQSSAIVFIFYSICNTLILINQRRPEYQEVMTYLCQKYEH